MFRLVSRISPPGESLRTLPEPARADTLSVMNDQPPSPQPSAADSFNFSPEALAGVIFDMDGVLCDSEPLICEAAIRMFRETYGLAVQPEDFEPFVGAGENRYIGGVAEAYGQAIDIERDKARTYAIYLEIIRGRLGPLPGAKAFVSAARQAGLKLAVATSADRVKMEGNLREISLPAKLFDACVTGSDIERKKPAPDIFLAAAGRLGLPAERTLVVEDAPNGVRAGVSAGGRVLALTTSFDAETLRQAGANWTAATLADVPAEAVGW
jgi:HAD superfamily hydrolase (TIGR01509 family)